MPIRSSALVRRALGCAVATLVVSCGRSLATTSYEQTYLHTSDNWAFRDRFPAADRLLNAFDYGHAILYQTLLTRSNAAAELEGPEFAHVTQQVLRHPPAVPLDEATVGPAYVALVPEVVATFEWAHMLHRQLYDVWAAYGLTPYQRDAEVRRLVAYYRSRPDLALSTRPKSMSLMEGQPYSLAFRKQDPKFNGLLWSYHWFQMALYDALMGERNDRVMHASTDTVVARFFRMLADAPAHMPAEMPMSPAAAPLFAERYPDAAIIFDNLHSLHDVVSDILVSPIVPPKQKRAAILAAAAAYRDDTTAVISVDEWRDMARMMAPPVPP
jgi:hypothetical protein